MTYKEFQKKYCSMCGTQRCEGIYSKEWREGCKHYQKEKNKLINDRYMRG